MTEMMTVVGEGITPAEPEDHLAEVHYLYDETDKESDDRYQDEIQEQMRERHARERGSNPLAALASMQLSPELRDLLPDLVTAIRDEVRRDNEVFLADTEFRLRQTMDIERRSRGEDSGVRYAEDLNVEFHQLTGWAYTNDSPSAGSIAWTAVRIVFNGVDYACADGNTANKWVWFVKPASGTVATLQTGNAKPVLTPVDTLVFYNNNGKIVNMMSPGVIAPSVMDGGVGTAELANGAVTEAKTTFYTALNAAVTQAGSDASNALAKADGAISSYFQEAAPWADGTARPASDTGDLWYRPSDGQAFRWTGPAPGGSIPVNNWFAIEDSSINAALSAANAAQGTANAKITIWYANLANPPSATNVNDLWIVLDQGNQERRTTVLGTGGWTVLAKGTAALADGAVTDIKVAAGLSGAKLVNGSVTDTQIGSVGGGKITAGTVGATQMGAGAITPVKLNILQHVLY